MKRNGRVSRLLRYNINHVWFLLNIHPNHWSVNAESSQSILVGYGTALSGLIMLWLGQALSKFGVDLSMKALVRKEGRWSLGDSCRSVGMYALEEMAGFEHLLGLWKERKFFSQEAWFNIKFKCMD